MPCVAVFFFKIKRSNEKFKLKWNHINKMKYPNWSEFGREYNFYLCYIFHARNWIFFLFSVRAPHRLVCFFLFAPCFQSEPFNYCYSIILLNDPWDLSDLFRKFGAVSSWFHSKKWSVHLLQLYSRWEKLYR